MCINNNVRESY